MKKFFIKRYGIIIAILANLLIYLFNILIYITIGYIDDPLSYLGDLFALYLRFIFLAFMIIIMFLYVWSGHWKIKSLLKYYILFIMFFEITFIKFLVGLAEYPFDYNPHSGMIAVVVIPINFIVFISVGALFDYVKNKKIKLVYENEKKV